MRRNSVLLCLTNLDSDKFPIFRSNLGFNLGIHPLSFKNKIPKFTV